MAPDRTTSVTRSSLNLPPQGTGVRRRAAYPTSFSLLRQSLRDPLPANPGYNTPGRQKKRFKQEIQHELNQSLTRKNDNAYPNRPLSKECARCNRTVFIVTNTGIEDGKLVAFRDDKGFERVGEQHYVCINKKCRHRPLIEPSGFSPDTLEADLDLMSLLERRLWLTMQDANDYRGGNFPEPLPWPLSGAARTPSPPPPPVRRPRPRPVHVARDQPPLPALPVPIQPPQPVLPVGVPAQARAVKQAEEDDEIIEVDQMDTREIYIIAWMEENKDPRIKVLRLASDVHVHLRRQGLDFARLGLEDAGALERLCPRRREWVPMDLGEAQFIGDSDALLIRSVGITRLPSLQVYKLLLN